ncbi:MAG: hypothetical protein M3507_08955 [Actinomycetota bacterium]|nr:hypothetical protein [Actinomycetota bacterium]
MIWLLVLLMLLGRLRVRLLLLPARLVRRLPLRRFQSSVRLQPCEKERNSKTDSNQNQSDK